MKKVNAVLGLLAMVLLLVHMGAQTYIYLTMSYLPRLSKITAYAFAAPTAAHALLGIFTVMFRHDEPTRVRYPRQNRATIVQRVSGLGILLLLPLHANTFEALQRSAGRPLAAAGVLLAEAVFFLLVLLHVGTSASRGLITLGVLDDMAKKKRVDIAVWCVWGLALLCAAFIIIRAQMMMAGL